MKDFLTVLIGVTTIILSIISYTFAYTQEQRDAYQWAYKYGITTQPTIEQAKMNSPLTRQAFAKMVINYLENVVGIKQSISNYCSFTDESKITSDLKSYTKKTCSYEIMGSNGKNFNPTQPVDRAQLGTVFSRILWGDKYNNDGKWYYANHLNTLKNYGIMNNINKPTGTSAKRGDVMIMFKRIYEKFGTNVYMNNGNLTSTYNSSNEIDNIITDNDKYLTKEEVQRLIEKEEGLKENSLKSRGYECFGETCTYEFEYSINGKKYIYYRNNKVSGKTEKVQDLGVNNAIDVALKDANVSRSNAEIEKSSSSNEYFIIITVKDNVFVYEITLDGKIKNKKTLITGEKALIVILKEIKLEQAKSDIEKENKEICSLSYSFLDDNHDIYHCSFNNGGKQYISYINAKDGSFIPIKKTSYGIQYGESIAGKQNVIITEEFSYIDIEKAKDLLIKKYSIEDGQSSWVTRMGEGNNAIYIYSANGMEYYIDATNGTKMNSMDEIISDLAKDSGVSKNIIKNYKQDEEDETISDMILRTNYVEEKTRDVVRLYSFSNQGITHTYKVKNIDGKILNSKKESDIGKDRAIELAKQSIQKKYSAELQDDYEIFNWSTAYLRYLSSISSDETLKSPSESEYVVSFLDESEENIYRVIINYKGNILSEDKISMENLESNFIAYGFYFMGYNLEDLENLEINVGGTFGF